MAGSPSLVIGAGRRRVGELRAEAGQIAGDGLEDRGGRLNGDVGVVGAEPIAQLTEIRHEQRLAAGDDYVPGWKCANTFMDGGDVHLDAFRLPRSVRRVAPAAAEIAPRRAH